MIKSTHYPLYLNKKTKKRLPKLKHVNDDLLSPELRNVEKEIDNYYKENLLCNIQFAEAAWHFLSFCEDIIIKEYINLQIGSIFEHAIYVDNLVNHMNYPLFWLKRSCPSGGKIPYCLKDDIYQAAWDLSELSENYFPFNTVFTYASRGIIDLELKNNTIIPHHDFISDTQFEAYDRLIKPSSPIDTYDCGEIPEMIARSLKI